MNSASQTFSLKNGIGEKQIEKLIDSAESATNKFRECFEAFLHQDKSQDQSITSSSGATAPTTTRINQTNPYELSFFSNLFLLRCRTTSIKYD